MSKTKKNIILDLDQTLIYSETLSKYDPASPGNNRFEHIKLKCGFVTYARPHLQEFLDFLFKNFNVSIWTAADKEYAIEIINKFILVKPRREINFIFYRYHCNLSKKKNNGLKRLNMLWNFYNMKKYNTDNTIIIDDNYDVKHIQTKNCYHIPSFDIYSKNVDTELLKLMDLLKTNIRNNKKITDII